MLASRAFFPTCLLPCTRCSHGRHSLRLLAWFTLARIACLLQLSIKTSHFDYSIWASSSTSTLSDRKVPNKIIIGVIFSRFSGERRQARSEVRQTPATRYISSDICFCLKDSCQVYKQLMHIISISQ